MARLSNGCRRCLQRKRRCDERKPGCLNCEKYGTPCPGYDKEKKWVDQTNKIANRYGMALEVYEAAPKHKILEINPARMHNEALLGVIDSLYAPKDGILTTEWSFLGRLADISCWAPELRAALQAATVAQVATVSDSKKLRIDAKVHNGRALLAVAKALKYPEQHPLQTAAAAMILAFCQYFNAIAAGQSAWRSHIMGSLALARVPGDYAKTNPLALDMLRTLDLHLVWSAIFDGPEDLPLLREHLDQIDTEGSARPAVAFIESMDAIQAHLRQIDDLEEGEASWPAIQVAIQTYEDLQTQLEGQWGPPRKHFPETDTDSLLSASNIPNNIAANDSTPVAHHFDSMVDARAYGRYLQAKFYLAGAGRRITTLVEAHYPEHLNHSRDQVAGPTEMEFMDELCKCIPSMCTPEKGLGGQASALIFLLLARPFYQHHAMEHKYRWCQDLTTGLDQAGVTL